MKKDRTMCARSMMLVLAAAMLAGLGACAGTAPSRFYSLSPVPASETRAVAEGRSLTVGVMQIKMPDYLDRPQIATRIGPNEFRFDEFNRWAEPLKENFSRVLAENLSTFLGKDKWLVISRPGALPLDYQVWVDVVQFDAGPGGDVSLAATWVIYQPDGKKVLLTKRSTLLEPAGAPGYEAMAAAGSRAVAGLSREIAEAIRALP
jgi:uncharacterized protein